MFKASNFTGFVDSLDSKDMSKFLRKLGLKKPVVIDYWDCSKLNLYDLPKEVFRHRQTLKSLYINNNNIRDIPKAIFMIEGLEELDISENDVLFIPPAVSKLPNLTTLIINKNSLASIPDTIRHCEQLLTLDLSINPLGSLCEGVTELRQLRKLILNDTQLEELPPNIGKLSKLEVLELRENMLTTLPGSMGHLTLLEKLDIGNNEFMTLPTIVGRLESLYELWIDSNTINSIPEELGSLHNLRFLEMSENHIMVLPNTIGGWVKLTDLYANENLISLLPDAFGMLTNLQIAKLNSNRLGGLPETVYGLTSLIELDLSHNHITELPNSIGGMSSLTSLNIDENLLTSLPSKIGNCSKLEYFSVRDNQLFEIPPECGGLTQLKIFNVVGNRLSNLPFTLTGLKHLSSIWVAENQSRPIVELQVEKGHSGEKWLTCFLFPQQGRESPFEEANSPLDAVADEDRALKAMNRKSSQVNFDPEVLDKRSKLSRDPTPFPKELHNKAMQWRAARDIHPELEGPLPVSPSGEELSPQPEEVSLRPAPRRLVKNRYSLIRAFSDPLDEHLKPVGGYRYKSPPIASPPADKSPSPSPLSPGRYSPTTNGLPPSSSHLRSPLPPASSPNGSIQHVRSGPHIDPPSDFAVSHGRLSPRNASPNGGMSHQQADNRFHSREHQIVPQGSPNSNGNNNQAGASRNRFPNQSISLGMVNQVIGRNEAEQNVANLQQYQFPSQASTLSHPESRSSMESGFDADSELENQRSPWYNSQSPNTSPKRPVSHDNRAPVLGPQITLPTTHTNSRHARTESRDSHHSGSQMSQHESLSDDYERLVFNSQPLSHSGRASTLAEQRRGSLDAVVMLSVKEKSSTYTYGQQQEYDQAYPPVHQPSRSYDATGHRGPRSQMKRTPPSSHHSQESQPSARPPVPPSNRSSSRSSSARSRSEKRSHVRNHSQPDHLSNMPASYYHTTHSNSQPDSQSPGQFYPHRERRSSSKSNDGVFQTAYPGHRGVQTTDQHASRPHHSHDSRSHNMHKTTRGRFYSDMHSRIVENEPYDHNPSRHHSERLRSYPNYPSDDSNSRQSTPVATPTLATKSNYVSGNDSGFDSMNRGSKSTVSSCVSPGNQYYVELEKNPTLGLSITGGKGGDNAIKPGDPGFHVYKIAEGLPAHQVGVIAVGDRLLKVNDHDVSLMTCEDVLSLLTYQEQRTVTLLLSKEPSQTLL